MRHPMWLFLSGCRVRERFAPSTKGGVQASPFHIYHLELAKDSPPPLK